MPGCLGGQSILVDDLADRLQGAHQRVSCMILSISRLPALRRYGLPLVRMWLAGVDRVTRLLIGVTIPGKTSSRELASARPVRDEAAEVGAGEPCDSSRA